jgi:hypothetical protein
VYRWPAAAEAAVFCSALPQRSNALMQSVFCTSTSTPTDGSIAEISSTARTASKKVPPEPEYSDWNFNAHQAQSIELRQADRQQSAGCSSIWRTSGWMVCCAKARTVSRNSFSSSVNGLAEWERIPEPSPRAWGLLPLWKYLENSKV